MIKKKFISKYLVYYVFLGGFWFRLNGYGLLVINRNINPPLFSSRNKGFRLWNWQISLLK